MLALCHFRVLMGQHRRERLADSPRPAYRAAGYLAAPRYISPELALHCFGQSLVLDQDVQLVVPKEARGVEVAGADPHPPVVTHDALGVQHRPVPLVDSNTASEKVTVPD